MKQRELEMRLQGLEGFAKPRPDLEQYPTPAKMAAEILYLAHARGDIAGKCVMDLGCGTGVFCIGACLLGAASVVGLDMDGPALEVAKRNALASGCEIDFIHSPVEAAAGRHHTCIMNPPFGSQTRHADVPFLMKAMEIADAVYTMHNSCTAEHIRALVAGNGWSVELERNYKFEIRHTFDFHRKERAFFDVTLFGLVKA